MKSKHLITREFIEDYNDWCLSYPEINSTDYKIVKEFENNVGRYLDSKGRPKNSNAAYIYSEYQRIRARYSDVESRLRKHLLHYLRLANFSELVEIIEVVMSENGY